MVGRLDHHFTLQFDPSTDSVYSVITGGVQNQISSAHVPFPLGLHDVGHICRELCTNLAARCPGKKNSLQMEASIAMGVPPIAGWFTMENPNLEMDD